MSTTKDTGTDVGPLNQEQRVAPISSSFDSKPDKVTDMSSFRCILNEESPDLDNPGLYNCKTCTKGFVHRSRKLFEEEGHSTSNVTVLGNHEKDLPQDDHADSVTNLQNCEGVNLQIPESSVTSNSPQFITSPMLHLPGHTSNAKLNEEQKQFPKNSFKKSKCVQAQENQVIFICHACGKVFRLRQSIIAHLRIHETNIEARRPYKCNKCVKRFTMKYSLNLHMMTHQRDETQMLLHGYEYKLRNPYGCEECCARFEYKERLKQHMVNNHGAATKFICTQCKKYFIFNSFLEIHLSRVHKSNS